MKNKNLDKDLETLEHMLLEMPIETLRKLQQVAGRIYVDEIPQFEIGIGIHGNNWTKHDIRFGGKNHPPDDIHYIFTKKILLHYQFLQEKYNGEFLEKKILAHAKEVSTNEIQTMAKSKNICLLEKEVIIGELPTSSKHEMLEFLSKMPDDVEFSVENSTVIAKITPYKTNKTLISELKILQNATTNS